MPRLCHDCNVAGEEPPLKEEEERSEHREAGVEGEEEEVVKARFDYLAWGTSSPVK